MKTIKKEEAQEGEIVETHWDLKKIVIGIVALAFVFILGSYAFKYMGRNTVAAQPDSILGVSTENTTPTPALPSKEDIQNVINNAQETLSSITSDNLTASSAAIQKVITDLQGLEGKKDAMGVFCQLVCKDK